MIDRGELLRGLRQQIGRIRRDLVDRVPSSVRDEYAHNITVGRTAASWTEWRDEQIAQTAVAWVLAWVFVRFSEDNGLLGGSQTSAGGPPSDDANWLLTRLDALAQTPAGDLAFGQLLRQARAMPPSDQAARGLVAFWHRGDSGGMAHDFTDSSLDTGFLADLYQDLDESARQTYSLLQTPPFVADLILDLTLDRAVEEFGLPTIRLIDPVCGSGQFLLGAFDRLCASWLLHDPALSSKEVVRRALDAIHGVDINPSAIAITRFRLLITSMRAAGLANFGEVSELGLALHLSCSDSLLRPEPCDPLTEDVSSGRHPDAEGICGHPALLHVGRYHVVVGNPPYITVKDQRLNELYRKTYDACSGKYALTVPFAQRFFQLAKLADQNGNGPGYVGSLLSNSFMKREFGRKLVEEFLAGRVTLTDVIDTSGAFIPGHGTPTVILVGRNRPRAASDRTRGVLGLRGEPEVPRDSSKGKVWLSIRRHAFHDDEADRWTQSLYLSQTQLGSFPWTLADPTANQVLDRMSTQPVLSDFVDRIGYMGNTGSDDIFTAPSVSFSRLHAEPIAIVDVLTGSEIRDWTVQAERQAFLPRDGQLNLIDIDQYPEHLRRLWPYRTTLACRRNHTGRSYEEDGRAWYDWHHVAATANSRRWMITFPWVATHNHFALLRERIIPLTSAPVILLPERASESDHTQLVTLLNSSIVCFWLRQQSNSKGQPNAEQTGGSEAWTDFYEFTAGRLGQLPVPVETNLRHAAELDRLSACLMARTPMAVVSAGAPTHDRLRHARDDWNRTRSRMIALQEESDWEAYQHYGLVSASDSLVTPIGLIPPLEPGERAFEIYLARKITAGDTTTTWFSRHGSTPITDSPAHWPEGYREVVRRRIAAIEAGDTIRALEQPEFKRRWVSEGWDMLQHRAIREWLLDRCAAPEHWYENVQPRPLEIQQLVARLLADSSVIAAMDVYDSKRRPDKALSELLASEHIPCLAALRYRESGLRKYAVWTRTWKLQRENDSVSNKETTSAQHVIPNPPRYVAADFLRQDYWRQRGKNDVANERFVSYPQDPGTPLLLGWAGWRHYERTQVLVELVGRVAYRGRPEPLIPLLAALYETSTSGPTTTQAEGVVHDYLARTGLRPSDLEHWRPPAPRRGRPRKVA